jgi:hypothetical protein
MAGALCRPRHQWKEMKMSVKNAPAADGKTAAKALLRETHREEVSVEDATGKPLKKGAARFDERSKSSDGKSAGAKQMPGD